MAVGRGYRFEKVCSAPTANPAPNGLAVKLWAITRNIIKADPASWRLLLACATLPSSRRSAAGRQIQALIMPITLTQLELKKLRSAEALYYSYELLHLSHKAMWPSACKIPIDNSQLFGALAACWTFIDSLHRVREIAQGAPGINSKSAEMRSFLLATSLAEDYRHYIQHLRREVSRDPPNASPVYGSLSWVDPEDAQTCHTVMLGAIPDSQTHTSCAFDTVENRWVSKVCLSIAEHSFNFDPMWEAALAVKAYLLHLLTNSAPLRWPPQELPLFSARFDLSN